MPIVVGIGYESMLLFSNSVFNCAKLVSADGILLERQLFDKERDCKVVIVNIVEGIP